MKYLKGLLVKFLIKYVASYAKGEKMESIRLKLSGWKTYLTSIAAIIGVVVAWSNNAMTTADAIQAIVTAVLAMTVRAGIASK